MPGSCDVFCKKNAWEVAEPLAFTACCLDLEGDWTNSNIISLGGENDGAVTAVHKGCLKTLNIPIC